MDTSEKLETPAADTRQVQAAYCRVCGGWIVVACFPDCQSRKDTQKQFAACAVAGDTVKVLLLTEWNASDCELCSCPKPPKKARR